MPTDARERERKALEKAHRQVLICASHCHMIALSNPQDGEKQQSALDPAHGAIDAYGRAVREADKEAARHAGNDWPLDYTAAQVQAYRVGRIDAAAAIEALGRDDG